MTTKYRTAASVAEDRILEVTATFTTSTEQINATMPNTKTVRVPHLGGIDAAYQMPHPYDSSKPTAVLVNSFTTSSELYRSQYANTALTDKINLISIELLGHGQTRVANSEGGWGDNWTYWDTAIMNLQVLDALKVEGKVVVLGTSQGGWICVRMALLAPGRIAGIVPLGTSMDAETQRTRDLGCWAGPKDLNPMIDSWTASDNNFEAPTSFCDFLINVGFGEDCPKDVRNFWTETIKSNYQGDDGRKRIRMCAINLSERDGLHKRLPDVKCPVLWMHGTDDAVYTVKNAEEEIKLFTGSPEARVQVVEGGKHFLSFSHPEVVDKALAEFVVKVGRK